MIAIQLFGTPASVSTRRVLITLKELSIPYTLHLINTLKNEQKLPATTQYQPFGQIPYMHDLFTGIRLYESRAIARYVVRQYDPDGKSGLLPSRNVGEWARFEQAASVELTKFEQSAGGLATELVFKPVFRKQPTDHEAAAKHLANLNNVLDVYDAILSKQKYIAGEHLTLVDLFHLPVGTRLTEANLDLLTTDTRLHVHRWWKDISMRPAWQVIKADNAPLS